MTFKEQLKFVGCLFAAPPSLKEELCDKCQDRGFIMVSTHVMNPDGTGYGSSGNAPCPNGCVQHQ